MSSRLFLYLKNNLIFINNQPIRHGHRHLGSPPFKAKTIKQRLEELNYKDPELYAKIDIGFKVPTLTREELSGGYDKYIKEVKSNPELERMSRKNELKLNLEDVKKDWLVALAPKQIKTIADHYGIYDDLFGYAYFHPTLPLRIEYDFKDEEKIAFVHRGNLLTPTEAADSPTVSYDADPNSLWTLLLTTPDGNFTSRDLEYCHWFIGNIPGNNIEKGDLLVDYLRPIPAYGLGYCRYIFILYKQEGKIDFSEYKLNQPCFELEKRNWKTQDFYRKYQDVITPAGLAFYQACWDENLFNFYHETLQMKVPKFEYDFPKPYIRPQEWFPKKKPFNLYLDKYRDPKDINKDYLLKKMKRIHPFKEPPPPLRFPNAHSLPHDMPSWLRLETKKERLGFGRINEIE